MISLLCKSLWHAINRPNNQPLLYKYVFLYFMIFMIWCIRDVRRSWRKPSLRDKKPQSNSWCPYCGGEHIWKYGFNSAGTPRYKCCKCDKTFSLWGKKKRIYTDVFKTNIVFYCQIRSYWGIRATCRACGISTNTLYRWLKKYGNNVPQTLDERINNLATKYPLKVPCI